MASIAGVGDMVIGLNTDSLGEAVWHAVIQRHGATYDPTMGQWFGPGVYETTGFSPRLVPAPGQVQFVGRHRIK